MLAAAVTGRAGVVVTSNLGHFLQQSREPYNIDAQGPDKFLRYQWEQSDAKRFVAIPKTLDGPTPDTRVRWRGSWKRG